MTKNTITTIEGLAALINETMASKEDIKEFRAEVKQKFEVVESRLDRIDTCSSKSSGEKSSIWRRG
jgi:hypothetical protein